MTAGPAAGGTAPPPRLSRQIGGLVFNVGAPVAVYYALHGAGVPSLAALAAGAVFPALGALWPLAVRHQADMVAVVVLATLAGSLVISLIAHSPRFLLARDGLITGIWGAWFLATLAARRPAAYLFARPLMEGRRVFAVTSWDELWAADPRFRRIWRVSTVLWAAGLLADAVIRVVMAYTLPVDVVPGLGGALYPVTFILLQLVTNVYYQMAGLNRMLGARWLAPAGPARTQPPEPGAGGRAAAARNG
ncbi:MAG TPA: VC0807 family protein [Streptosporangiaceae bacterium]|jgi:hypothetical protein